MIADVPLGAFLSGGIDSSTIVALMQIQSSQPVKTFTIGFLEPGYNEAENAKLVAQHLGTEHTELYVTPQEAMDVVPTLPTLYDEPYADSSQIPTHLVSRLARRHVTVSLSGDGGDELFGGYNRYFAGPRIWNRVSWMPERWRSAAASAVTAVSPSQWDRAFERVGRLLPGGVPHVQIGNKASKLADVLRAGDLHAAYLALVSMWPNPEQVVIGGSEPATVLSAKESWPRLESVVQRMMYLDAVTYLPDDILAKVDRATMAVSLESRIPFLDHRVVEFAWRLPVSMKVRNGRGKWLLRQVLQRHVPRDLIERPKQGFAVPVGDWIRGPMRSWAEELLDERRLRDAGYLDPAPIREVWRQHLEGRRNAEFPLWGVLMFEAWRDSVEEAAPIPVPA
jgi:asparagine synthase (glutamine-hydrolysing)